MKPTRDLLLDRDCAILDGQCDCVFPTPVLDHCKKYTREDPYVTDGGRRLARGNLVEKHIHTEGRYLLPDQRKGLEE